MPASSSRRRAARCSSTRSANCRPPPRSSCCARSRRAKSSRSAARKPSRSMSRMISATNRNLIDRRQSRPLPRGPVLPPARVSDHGAAAARARRGHPRADPPFPGPIRGRRGQAHPCRCRADAWRCWPSYRWPGNVRQLENAIFRAVVLAEGEEIGLNEFPQIAAQRGNRERPEEPAQPQSHPVNFADLAPVLGPAIQLDEDAGRALLPTSKESFQTPPNLLQLLDDFGHSGPSKRSRRR